jgi:hypothetical protein
MSDQPSRIEIDDRDAAPMRGDLRHDVRELRIQRRGRRVDEIGAGPARDFHEAQSVALQRVARHARAFGLQRGDALHREGRGEQADEDEREKEPGPSRALHRRPSVRIHGGYCSDGAIRFARANP